MIPNGNLKKNRIIPVHVGQNTLPELTEDERILIADTLPLKRRVQNGEPSVRVPRTSVTSAIESLGRAKIGFTRWRNTALEETQNERENSFKGLQRPRSRMKLGNPNKLNIHRMNAAQLSDLDDLVDDSVDGVPGREMRKKTGEEVNSPSRALLYYFAKLAANSNEQEVIDLEFVGTLIQSGADVNVTDRHGQSAMHEAARQWEIQVAKFLIDKGGQINLKDKYGRTPLHVAAAVDYPEMVQFLIDSGADLHARTEGELQTPIHFAARNDAGNSLKTLIKCGAGIEDRDYKNRTPLQVAAELDRSETSKLLIEMGADAGVQDESGMTALVMMISKMPPVAKLALDQFYSRDRANRKQYFYLNYLEPAIPKVLISGWPQTAMEVAVLHKQFDLIMHPVFQRLIKVKWHHFGQTGAWIQFIMGFLFVTLWTIFGVTTSFSGSHNYSPLDENWWRIVVGGLAFLLTLNEILREITEYFFSKKEHLRWTRWRESELKRDLEHCHPRWPGERLYLMQEMETLQSQGPAYFKDAWNIFDWITYFMILTSVITHVVSVLTTYREADKIHTNLMSATIIFLWIRLLKACRPFRSIGPFVVMGGHLIFDVLKFGLLYIILYIPYAASFWMVFASHKVNGYTNISDLLYSMFRMTVVDEYNYDDLSKAEPIMSKILCSTYIALSAIVCLNLFIALMSDTFQRVYDNVKANSVMQQASTILSLENGLSCSRRRKFASFIHSRCAPDELFYDDDIVDDEESDLKRMTHQIKDGLDEVHEILKTEEKIKGERINSPSRDVQSLRKEMTKLEQQQIELSKNVNAQFDEIKSQLSLIIEKLNKRKKRAKHTDEVDAVSQPTRCLEPL